MPVRNMRKRGPEWMGREGAPTRRLQGNPTTRATYPTCNLELGRLVAGCRRGRLNAGATIDMGALTVSLPSSSLYGPHCVSKVLNSPLRICLADLDMWIWKNQP